MIRKLSSYPRLHVAPSEIPQSATIPPEAITRLAQAFQQATGWSLQFEFAESSRNSKDDFECAVHIGKPGSPSGNPTSISPTIESRHAQELAEAVGSLVSELNRLQLALWHREAELAVGIPVAARQHEQEHLAQRLESTLRGGAEAIQCQAAGLYMLGDVTNELKLRACWGLPKQRLLDPARNLETSLADLETLVGQAVVLEDTSRLPHWKTPEPYPAAICVPVSSPTDLLGTLWFFAHQTRDFTDEQVHVAEIVAGRIASELQREALLGECLASKQAERFWTHALQWQSAHLPTIKPWLDGWEVAGWSAERQLASGFYDWFVPPDGSLAIALGTCDGCNGEPAFGASALQASLRSHAMHPHQAMNLLTRVNDTLWTASAGGPSASLFYGLATPHTGQLQYALAGEIYVLHVGPGGCEWIPPESPPLGVAPELRPRLHRHVMQVGEACFVLGERAGNAATQLEISRILRRQTNSSAEAIVDLIRQSLPENDLVLVLRRTPNTSVPGH